MLISNTYLCSVIHSDMPSLKLRKKIAFLRQHSLKQSFFKVQLAFPPILQLFEISQKKNVSALH